MNILLNYDLSIQTKRTVTRGHVFTPGYLLIPCKAVLLEQTSSISAYQIRLSGPKA